MLHTGSRGYGKIRFLELRQDQAEIQAAFESIDPFAPVPGPPDRHAMADIQIRLESDLGTSMRGDTLFGQLCWMLRLREGESALEELLEGYTDGAVFLIVSDGCPQGFVPKPDLPPPPGVRCCSRPSVRKVPKASTARICFGARSEKSAIEIAINPRTTCESLSPR